MSDRIKPQSTRSLLPDAPSKAVWIAVAAACFYLFAPFVVQQSFYPFQKLSMFSEDPALLKSYVHTEVLPKTADYPYPSLRMARWLADAAGGDSSKLTRQLYRAQIPKGLLIRTAKKQQQVDGSMQASSYTYDY